MAKVFFRIRMKGPPFGQLLEVRNGPEKIFLSTQGESACGIECIVCELYVTELLNRKAYSIFTGSWIGRGFIGHRISGYDRTGIMGTGLQRDTTTFFGLLLLRFKRLS